MTRVCTVGHRNACSMLYGRLCRAAAALGYVRAYTYTEDGEDAASVKAAGFVLDGEVDGDRSWDSPGRRREDETLFGPRRRRRVRRFRWRRDLA